MPFIFLAVVMVLVAIFMGVMAAHEHSTEMAFGAGAIALAGIALAVVFLVFQQA